SQALSSYLEILKSCENSPLKYLREIDKLIHLFEAAEPEQPRASPAAGGPDVRSATASSPPSFPPIRNSFRPVFRPVNLVIGCRGHERVSEPPAAAATTAGNAAAG